MKSNASPIAVVLLLAVASLSGCIYQIMEGYSTSADWHQPGIWEALPTGDSLNGFRVETHNTYTSASRERGEKFQESFSVTVHGDVHYRVSTKPNPLSSDETWETMRAAFKALSLPQPSLDSDFRFAERTSHAWAKWEQQQVWNGFPEEGEVDGFEVFVHDSFKVAQKIEGVTSEWVRVNDDGEVSFRFEQRGDIPNISEGDFLPMVFDRLHRAFGDLGLPNPEITDPDELNLGPWPGLDPV